jgi:dnd system-associated protein 4
MERKTSDIFRQKKYNDLLTLQLLPIFKTLKEGLCFCALLGFSQKKRTDYSYSSSDIGISWDTFTGNQGRSHRYVYLIALAETKEIKILSGLQIKGEDMYTIFEQYADGGLEIISKWADSDYDGETLEKNIIRNFIKIGYLPPTNHGEEADPNFKF